MNSAGRSILTTALRYGLIWAAIGGVLELALDLPGLLRVPGGAPSGPEMFFGLLIAFLHLFACFPLFVLFHEPSPPVWMLPLNFALWGFAVGAIVGMFRAAKKKGGSKGHDSAV